MARVFHFITNIVEWPIQQISLSRYLNSSELNQIDTEDGKACSGRFEKVSKLFAAKQDGVGILPVPPLRASPVSTL